MAASRSEFCAPTKSKTKLIKNQFGLRNEPSHLDEIRQAFGNVIKQLCTGTKHNTLWDGVDF